MTISGKFVDNDTGKPLGGVVMDIFATGDLSGTPVDSEQANDDGTFSVTSSYLDSPGANVVVQYPGYSQMVGSPGLFNGNVSLYPTSVTTVLKSIPWWAYAAVVVLVLALIHFKYKKLF